MKEKFRVECTQCRKVFGVFDTSKVEMPDVCDECGSRKITTTRFTPQKEAEQMDFDIVIFNKKTGTSKTTGLFIDKTTMEKFKKTKNLQVIREKLATEMAKSIYNVLKKDSLLVDLIGGEKNESDRQN